MICALVFVAAFMSALLIAILVHGGWGDEW